MNGVLGVETDTSSHTVDVLYDDSLVTVPAMKDELDSNYYYVAYANVSASQALEVMNSNPSSVTVDVRDRYEYCDGHIDGALNSSWNSGQFQKNYRSILPAGGTVILVCRSGNRSALAADYIYNNYFSLAVNGIVYNLTTGMNGWNYGTTTCPEPPPPSGLCQPWLNLLLQ